ncbi:hypothetical protein [Streptosporangium sp. NPDC051022]|uniref:hypothetical protein n=1 Tax=Streptosporangium sp. NPDC051022 TaxID=3155752 RepID=UPI00343054FC
MGHPIQPCLRNDRSGIVHRAIDGVPACPARTRTGAYTATDAPVTCKHCLKASAEPQADIIALSDAQLDGIACVRCGDTGAPMVPAGHAERGQLFECTRHREPAAPVEAPSPRELSDSELMVGYYAGYLSAVTILRDVIAEIGLNPDEWALDARQGLTSDEHDEIAHAARLVLWRRRGVKVPADPMSEAAMSAGVLLGVELAERYGVVEARRRATRGADGLTRLQTEKTVRFVRGLVRPSYVEDPEGSPCGDLRCGICYITAVAA